MVRDMVLGSQRPTIETRRANACDTAQLVQTLSHAFQTEPAFSHMLPDDCDRKRRLPKVFRIMAGQDLRVGQVFCTAGGEALTMWRTPEKIHDSAWDDIRQGIPYALVFGSNLKRAITIGESVKRNMPEDPGWYLHFAACDPAHQGKGFGGAAIRAGLVAVDAAGSKAYLETADEANLPIYNALGFAVTSSWQVNGGPTFWGMTRPAQK
jgi:ribosomal protein S18 acetylase RimI-like enzyme